MIIIDTNIISTFCRIDELPLLYKLFPKHDFGIPATVFDEVMKALQAGYSSLENVFHYNKSYLADDENKYTINLPKKVDANVNVSYGSLLYPVDLLTLWCYRRIADRIRRSYPQLKDVDANYRVAVIDVRTEPINEFILWFMTQSWLIYKGAKYPKFRGQRCYGVDLSRTDFKTQYEKKRLDLSYLQNAYANYADKKKFFLKNRFIDKLSGSDKLRKQIESGVSEEEIRKSWEKDLVSFKKIRKKYLIYP